MDSTTFRTTRFKSLLGIEFSPVSFKEKVVSMAGGLISILCLILVTERLLHLSGASAVIASMGASAVLLFAVPHGQLSQPWPVFGGHVISAMIGVLCARWIQEPHFAAAFAVGLSIGMMHQFKCIHPPGGATALTAVLGGSAIHELGFGFVIYPVLVNCVLMIGIAVAFNAFFGWRRYPGSLGQGGVAVELGGPTHEEIAIALRQMDTFVDISEEDLVLLSRLLRKEPAVIRETE